MDGRDKPDHDRMCGPLPFFVILQAAQRPSGPLGTLIPTVTLVC